MTHLYLLNRISVLSLIASVLDLVFAIDGSDSLLPEQFEHLKQLAKNMIDLYSISEKATHVGVLEYSDKAVVEIKLNDFYKSWELKQAIDRIKSSNKKGVVTDEVLRKAADKIFNSENGARPGAAKVLVILTDDKSTGEEPLGQAVVPLNDKGVRIYVVSIGPNTDQDEIKTIVAGDKNIISTKTTYEVPPLAPVLKKQIEDDIDDRKLHLQ